MHAAIAAWLRKRAREQRMAARMRSEEVPPRSPLDELAAVLERGEARDLDELLDVATRRAP